MLFQIYEICKIINNLSFQIDIDEIGKILTSRIAWAEIDHCGGRRI